MTMNLQGVFLMSVLMALIYLFHRMTGGGMMRRAASALRVLAFTALVYEVLAPAGAVSLMIWEQGTGNLAMACLCGAILELALFGNG